MDKQQTIFFEQLLENNKRKILRICIIYAGGRENEKDLFQEIALNIWKSLPTFRKESSVETWLYRIALNVAMQYAIKRNFTKRNQISLEGIEISRNISATETDPETRERTNLLQGCIASLGDADKAIILLFLEDLPYKKISEITGISENHVAVKLKRIKVKLFNCIKIKSDE